MSAARLPAPAAALLLLAVLALAASCDSPEPGPEVRFAPGSMRPVLDMPRDPQRDAPDCDLSVQPDGSLLVEARGPGRLRLFDVPNDGPDALHGCIATYAAEVATRGLQSGAYLELLCRFSGQGTYFSRDLGHKLGGDTDWTAVSTPFRLEQGQRPASFSLNLVLEGDGGGEVLIRNVSLSATPLPPQ